MELVLIKARWKPIRTKVHHVLHQKVIVTLHHRRDIHRWRKRYAYMVIRFVHKSFFIDISFDKHFLLLG